jgi:hypothetical protein
MAMEISLDLDVRVYDGALVLTNRDGRIVTFSPQQSVQKKVSMITLGELSELPKIAIARSFGFQTRKSYYDIRKAVLYGTPAELLPKRPGPQKPSKRTKELEALIIQKRVETPHRNMYEIADELNEAGFAVSARLVGQVLTDYGLGKKNR